VIIVEPEPSNTIANFTYPGARLHLRLRPWRLPLTIGKLPFLGEQRFVRVRSTREGRALPGFVQAEMVARLWARGQTHRILHSKFVLRRWTEEWAARQSSLRQTSIVVAPSNTARSVFAAAPDAKKILIIDLPLLRRLHEDLRAAAVKYPLARYLGRYRAPNWAIVNQEVEWELADEIFVRGQFAREELKRAGVDASKIRILPGLPPSPRLRHTVSKAPGAVHVLLAGLAAARNGTHSIVYALEQLPWLHVHLRVGEGCEPQRLLRHSRVIPFSKRNDSSLEAMDAVVAPSLCESYHPELALAYGLGIPMIATPQGSGQIPTESLHSVLNPDNEHALCTALERLFPSPSPNPNVQ